MRFGLYVGKLDRRGIKDGKTENGPDDCRE